jgi:pimeloyl-[acyl-carrier protein] methyl ester esterase
MSVRWILLPGMDGIGRFRTLREALGGETDCRALSYPPDVPLGYDALTARVRESLQQESRYILVAESFSGPIAIRLAADNPPGLQALVLAASFCDSPIRGAKRVVLRALAGWPFRLQPPRWLAKYFLLGSGAPPRVIEDLYGCVGEVSRATLQARLRELLRVDACARLTEVRVPVLYLQATGDRLVDEASARRIVLACPQAEVHQLEAPHMILQRKAEQAVAVIREFLAWHKIF